MPNAARAASLFAYVLAAACASSRPPAVPESRPVERPGVTAEVFSPTDTGAFVRVRFARGTTSGIMDDSLAAGAERGYLLGALQDQVMLAHAIAWRPAGAAAAPEPQVRVYRGHDGVELDAPGDNGPLWFGHLPGTGDYVIRVSAPAERPVAYTLAVQIPRRLLLDRGHPTSEIAARTPSRAPVDFVVKGARGQVLSAELRGAPATGSPATLHVYGLDDGVQLAPLGERRRSWSGALPSEQDYVVSVIPPAEGSQYDLVVGMR